MSSKTGQPSQSCLNMKIWLIAKISRLVYFGICIMFLVAILNSYGAIRSVQRSMGVEPLHLHVHIPKTGGTSLINDLPKLLGLRSCNALFKIPTCCNATPIENLRRTLDGKCDISCDFLTYETTYKYFTDMFRNCHNREIRFVTSIRDPFSWRISQVLHDVRAGRYRVSEKVAGTAHVGYNLNKPIFQRLLGRGDTIPENAIPRFYFVFSLERYEEGLCTIQAKSGVVHSNASVYCQSRSWKKRNVVRGQALNSSFTTEEILKLRSLVLYDEYRFYSSVLRAYEEEVKNYLGIRKASSLDSYFAV